MYKKTVADRTLHSLITMVSTRSSLDSGSHRGTLPQRRLPWVFELHRRSHLYCQAATRAAHRRPEYKTGLVIEYTNPSESTLTQPPGGPGSYQY